MVLTDTDGTDVCFLEMLSQCSASAPFLGTSRIPPTLHSEAWVFVFLRVKTLGHQSQGLILFFSLKKNRSSRSYLLCQISRRVNITRELALYLFQSLKKLANDYTCHLFTSETDCLALFYLSMIHYFIVS